MRFSIAQARGVGATTPRLYATFESLRENLPRCLAAGQPRVLKQDPGNGGSGVWKVEPTAPVAKGLAAFAVDARVRVRHAKRGSVEEELTPGADRKSTRLNSSH